MIRFKDPIGRFALPSGYHELTVAQFCTLLALGPTPAVTDVVCAIIGRVVAATDDELLAVALDWLQQGLPAPDASDAWPYPQNLGQETYIQVELLREALAKPVSESLPQVFGLMCARTMSLKGARGPFEQARAAKIAQQCQADPVSRVWPAFAHARAEIERLMTKYAELA